MLGTLRQRLTVLERRLQAQSPSDAPPRWNQYAYDPCGYARDVLGVTLTPDQASILSHLHLPPFKVLVPSAHDVGKTFVAAVAVNYWFDSFPTSVALTTAPTERDVIDLLWTEVRMQRLRAGLPMHFTGPRSPEMRTGEDHYAKGFTARKGESFQGRHRERMLFVFDEANGVDPIYWQTLKTMFDPELGHAVLCIFNPTDTGSAAYQEDLKIDSAKEPPWHRFRLSALNHPNVLADLEGEPRPIPGAVNLAMIKEWVRDWCEPIYGDDIVSTDVEWPPGSGLFYRPGPIFQCRAMGLWPDAGAGVWSDALFQATLRGPCPAWPLTLIPEIGCDTATGKGEDYHGIHGRWGSISLHHETANTMDPVRIYGRLKEIAQLLVDKANSHRDRKAKPMEATEVPIKIDDDGTGGTLCAFLRRDGYKAIPVGAATRAKRNDLYPNRRSENWFVGAGTAKAGLMYLGLLDASTIQRLRAQLTAPTWDLDGAGRRVVEKKDDTKETLGRSPDDADALNLAYCPLGILDVPEPVQVERKSHLEPGRLPHKRKMFGA